MLFLHRSLSRASCCVAILLAGAAAACSPAATPASPTSLSPAIVTAARDASAVTPDQVAPAPRLGAGTIASLAISPATIRGGYPAAGTVTLAAPAPAGGTVVAMASSDRDVRPPATITIAAGQTVGAFQIATSEPHADTSVRVTATTVDGVATTDIVLALEPPDGRRDSYTVPPNGSIVVRAPGVLINDERRTGHDLTAILLRRPRNGTLEFDLNGGFTYRAAPGISGDDDFTYRPMDGDTRGNEVTVILTVLPQLVAGPPQSAPVRSQTFSFTGASQIFVVPAGITQITVQASGAEGGTALLANPGVGGLGGFVEATIDVTPGTSYQVNVGGRGTDGTGGVGGGGAGGGASDIRTGANTLADRVVVAGGGGGGGTQDAATTAGQGGAGGGQTGVSGTGTSQGAGGGGGGTQAAGGAGGGGGQTGSGGAIGVGGAGAGPGGFVGVAGGFNGGGRGGNSGAGGGGGFYGGGGGGTANSGGGGGGGSSFVVGTAVGVTHTQGARSGDGQVIIRW